MRTQNFRFDMLSLQNVLVLTVYMGYAVGNASGQGASSCPPIPPQPNVFASLNCSYSNNGVFPRCGVPTQFIPVNGFNSSRNIGLRYTYMETVDPGTPVPKNKYTNAFKTIPGTFLTTGVTTQDVIKYTFWQNSGSDSSCHGYYQYGPRFDNGRRVYITYYTDTPTIEYIQIFTLYVDYEGLATEIIYVCPNANLSDTCLRTCSNPQFTVSTRIRPDLLTADQKSTIQNIVNFVLSPLCVTTANLTLLPWDNQPMCTSPIPACLAQQFQSQEGAPPPSPQTNLPPSSNSTSYY